MLLSIRSAPIMDTMSDFSFPVLRTGRTAVLSEALFAAPWAAFIRLSLMLCISMSHIRHSAANRKRGIPKAASTVRLPFFVTSGADALFDFVRDLSLFVNTVIATDLPFFKKHGVYVPDSARGIRGLKGICTGDNEIYLLFYGCHS